MDVELLLIGALVDAVRRAKGKRLSIKAATLVRLAGLNEEHSHILKAANVLSKLNRANIVKAEVKRMSRGRVLRYVIDESNPLWRIARESREKAVEFLQSKLQLFKRMAR